MTEPAGVHPNPVTPFPADRIVRRVIPVGALHDALREVLPGTPPPQGVMVVAADGQTMVYACEQALHAAVLVACADLLREREAFAADRAVRLALAEERRAHTAQVEARAHRLAVQLIHEGVVRLTLIATLAGTVAALGFGLLEWVG